MLTSGCGTKRKSRHVRVESAKCGIGDRAYAEIVLEQEVSRLLGSFTLLWLTVADERNASSLRAYIERNAIALLSNYNKEKIDHRHPRGWGRAMKVLQTDAPQ